MDGVSPSTQRNAPEDAALTVPLCDVQEALVPRSTWMCESGRFAH